MLIHGSSAVNQRADKGSGICGTIRDMLLRCVKVCQVKKGIAAAAMDPQPDLIFNLPPEVLNASLSSTGEALFPLDKEVDIDIDNALHSGAGMRPENMFKVSPPGAADVEEPEAEDAAQLAAFIDRADGAVRDTEVRSGLPADHRHVAFHRRRAVYLERGVH